MSWIASGSRTVGTIETIHGIPYPVTDSSIRIEEEMAHADIYLSEPVFGKNLMLEVTFDPQQNKSLEIGIRENSFWLSYPKVSLYTQGKDIAGLQTKEITIPLTDKIQEPNQSVDLMMFSSGNPWKLHSITANVRPSIPSWSEAKDYVKSMLYRERVL